MRVAITFPVPPQQHVARDFWRPYLLSANFSLVCLKIINGNSKNPTAIQSVTSAKRTRACILVRKCLDNDICENFQGYFELQLHKKQTRNSDWLIRLPCIKTEYTRKSFHFMGAKLYNELPIDVRKTESFKQYEELLKRHFS